MTDDRMNSSHPNHPPSHLARNNPDDRILAMLIYLLSFFTTLIAPLVIWLIKRNESRIVDKAGKNYFNFFISYLIWSIIFTIIFLIGYFMLLANQTALLIIGGILMGLSALVLFVLSILSFIFTIIACVKYMSNEAYLIPLSIRFFK